MADTMEDVQVQGDVTGIPGLDTDVFNAVLTAIAAGENVEAALDAVRESMRSAAVTSGASDAAASQAADVFLETFQNELFVSNRSPSDAADYAEQAMQLAIDTFDATQTQSSADALLAAMASGKGIEQAVSNVVADMIASGAAPQDPAAVEAAFLKELQESLAQGSSPQAALDSASNAADAQLLSQQQSSVPIENSILSSLANGENVGDALSDAARAAGGDANAFADGLEAALSQGMGADDALADARQAATDTEAAKQDGDVDLDAAGRLAQSLAQGSDVAGALQNAGGGEAFASTLEQSLASGTDAGQALAEADAAQQQQAANADAQSVPLSAADRLAAALANGIDMETLAQLSGDSAFADALEQSLASGQSPLDAMKDAQQAAEQAAAVAEAQDVPLSPADQLAASLASGENVDQAMDNAGQGQAFGEELISSLADGQTPGDAMTGAVDAQQSADATSQNQSVPSDPSATALAQGGDAAQGVDLAQAVADATGTTGGETEQNGQPASQQTESSQGAETASNSVGSSAGESTGDAGGNPGTTQSAAASTGESNQPSAGTQSDQQQQVASNNDQTQTGDENTESQTESETAKSVDQVAQGPGEQGESQAATGDDEATGDGVTETIQVAEAEGNPQGNAQNQTDPSVPEGGGSDQPTDEEIAALQEIESASGGNPRTPPSSPQTFQNNLNPGPFGNNGSSYTPTSFGPKTEPRIQSNTQTSTQPSETAQNQTPVNLNPILTSDAGAGTKNQTLTLSVLVNDYDPDGQPLTIINAAPVETGQGTVTYSGSVLTFTPGTDFDDLDAGDTENVTISYTVSDGVGGTASSTVSLVITGTNDVPVISLADSTVTGAVTEATDNAAPTDPALTASGDVKFFDVDADGTHIVDVTPSVGVSGVLTASITNAAAGATGTVSWDYTAPEGVFDYLADGQTATEVFRITVTDDQGTTAYQDITVTITGTNDSPIAVADVSATSENATVSIDVVANDTDVDNATASLSLTAASVPPGQGTVSIVGNQIQYNPGTDFEALAVGQSTIVQISYTVTDPGGLTSVSTVDVTVNGSNDAPLVAAPISVSPTTEDSGSLTIDLLAGASDIDDGTNLDTASVAVTSDDKHVVSFSIDNETGKLTINSGQFGYLDDGEQVTLSVTYNVVDGDGGSVPNTASVVVTGANDAPRFLTTNVAIASENFESGADGWSDTTVTTIDGLTQFLGNFGHGGATEKTFIIPNGALSASFSFDFYEMDSWDDETFSVLVNGNPILQKVFGQVGDQSDGNFTLKTLEDQDLGGASFNDQVYSVKFSLNAAQLAAFPEDEFGNRTITLGFSSTLNDPSFDESWGVDNLRISANVEANAAGLEDTTIAIDGLKVGDVDGDDLTVTIDVPDGILDLTDGGSGATLQNSGSASVTVSGTAAQINAALATLTYTPEANANGLVPVSLSVNDGTVTTNSSFDIIVAPVEDATLIEQPSLLNFTGAGADGDDASFSFAMAENFETFPTTKGTIEFWMVTTDQTGALASYAVPGSANEMWITLVNGDVQIWLNNTNVDTVSGLNVTNGESHHIALTFGPNWGDTVLYVDGNPVATLPATSELTAG
ncbi:MAG: tandem-95 repeat protein, partial [Alphaproteobacteria bacterium]|nr:tandem-95 repeat protein [Alphaproteobacteria bacterium]